MNVFLYRIILRCRHVYRAMRAICQTLADPSGVHPVCPDFLPRRHRHRGWCQNNTLHTVIRQLMVQAVPQTSGLIAAQNLRLVSALALHSVNVFDYLPVIRFHLRKKRSSSTL